MFRSVIGHDRVVRCSLNFVVEDLLAHEYFEREWTKSPTKEAITDADSGRSITYGDLLIEVKRLAAHLQEEGVREDQLVVFTAANSLRSCLTLLALIFCKCAIVMPKNSFTSFELEELLKNISVVSAFGDSVSVPKFVKVQQRHSTLKKVFSIDNDDYLGHCSPSSYQRPQRSDPKETVLMMVFTSGSTGPSKAVRATHSNFIANVYPFYDCYWSHDMVQLLTSAVSHLSGIYTMLIPLARTEKIVIASEYLKNDLAKFVDVIEKYKVNKVLLMPVTLNALVNASPEIKQKLKGLRVILTGGSITQETVVQRTREFLPDAEYFYNFYGLSETFGLVGQSGNAFDEGLGARVMPNCSMKIVDVATNETLPAYRQGEIWIQSPTIARGYLNNKKATESTFCNGWLRSGDIGFYDEQGHFYIVDRIKEMIKCLDSQIAPAEIEAVILKNASVQNAVVVGTPHTHYGEAPTAFVVPKTDSRNLNVLSEEIKADIKEKCATHKQLYGGLYFVQQLAKTDTGKFSRKDVLREHLENKLSYLQP